MQTLHIELPSGVRYPITIGAGLLSQPRLVQKVEASPLVCIVSNEVVAPLYLDAAIALLGNADRVESIILPDGEHNKTLETCTTVYDRLTELGAPRDTLLVALGGGVIGDLTGFIASTCASSVVGNCMNLTPRRQGSQSDRASA